MGAGLFSRSVRYPHVVNRDAALQRVALVVKHMQGGGGQRDGHALASVRAGMAGGLDDHRFFGQAVAQKEVGGFAQALLPLHFAHDGLGGCAQLRVLGPVGVDRVVNGYNEAYALDNSYRTAHHGEAIAPSATAGMVAEPFEFDAGQTSKVVLEDGGLVITAFEVDHSPATPAVGYRFDYKGRSVVITGDTKLTPSVATVSQGADILVHEALQPTLVNILGAEFEAKNMGNLAHVMRDILNYHTTPEEAAAQANAAQVKHLVYNHIVPPMPIKFAYPAFVGDAAKFFGGPITVGEDGMLFTLPANSTAIDKKRLM